MDAEQEYLLRKLLEGYLPAPAPVPESHSSPAAVRLPSAPSSAPAIWESLDSYERVFFAEGATMDYLEAVAAPWRATGLSPREVEQWLAVGVYPDEPGLASALAGAGFDPYEARRTTVGYRSDSQRLNIVSAVRGRSEQAAWAVELRQRLLAVSEAGGAQAV